MGQSVGSVDPSFFLGRYGRRSVQNADTGIRRMERGVSLPSSNPLGGSNFRESHPIKIKSVPPSHNGFKLRLRICLLLTAKSPVLIASRS
jgi:hypothetical protein